MIDVERYQRIDAIFQAALELDPRERSSYLSQSCGDDASLLKEVEYLLASDGQPWELIGTSAFEMVAPLLGGDQPDLDAGDSVGHYNVVSLLGVGGMGHVYLAEDRSLGRKVALKLLPKSYTRDESRWRRFQREARAASALNHPNILTIHELGQVERQQFIATEFVEGETLRERLKRGRLNLPETLDIAIQIAGALAAAHKAGIVHRDIKPENIMLRHDGYIKVLDFGLAKLTEQHESTNHALAAENVNVSSGLVMGTVKYMSPEQAQGSHVDQRSDIFSLGVVLYEMVTARPPFEGESSDLVTAILKKQPSLVEVPDGLRQIISRALSKRKEERFQTIDELLVDLRRLNENQSPGSAPGTDARWLLPSQRAWILAAVAGALVLLMIGGLIRTRLSQPPKAPLTFQQRDWVLITGFDNRTGEPVFDGTIESALERELSNSQFVNVITSERTGDVLRLMNKPANTRIDAALGREICLRDGGIRALLSGRVDKVGTTYAMSVSLVDPFLDRIVVSKTEEAANQESVWPALRRLSNWTRETLGEALPSIEQSSAALERVTTPSLRALQLYSQAMALTNQMQAGPAEAVLRQALAEDPNFASAHILLAHALRNQGKPAEEWEPPSQRAFELSQRTSDRERYFIEGSYYSMKAQYDKAVSPYEALVQQYPDHFWGRNNLAFAYFFLGRWQESVTQFAQAAELRPNDLRINRLAAWNLLQRDLAEARRVVQRADKLITPELASRLPEEVSWIELFAIHDFWVRGEVDSALRELDRWAQTIDAREGRERDAFAKNIGNCYLALGKIKAAEGLFRKLPENDDGHDLHLAEAAYAAGDLALMRKYLRDRIRGRFQPDLFTGLLLARAGLTTESQKILAEQSMRITRQNARGSVVSEVLNQITDGEIALSRGRTSEAISRLEPAVPAIRWNSTSIFFIESESLADAFERQGDLQKSVHVLERASREKAIAYDNVGTTGHYWLRVAWRLAELYRKLGRVEDAQKIESELSKTLAYSDPGHPLLVKLAEARRMNNQ